MSQSSRFLASGRDRDLYFTEGKLWPRMGWDIHRVYDRQQSKVGIRLGAPWEAQPYSGPPEKRLQPRWD